MSCLINIEDMSSKVVHRSTTTTISLESVVQQATLVYVTTVGVKTDGSRVGGPELCLRLMVTGGGGHNVYPGSGPLDGGNTLLLA